MLAGAHSFQACVWALWGPETALGTWWLMWTGTWQMFDPGHRRGRSDLPGTLHARFLCCLEAGVWGSPLDTP